MAKRDSSRRAAAADANVSRSSRVVQRRIIACSEKPGHRGKNIIKKGGYPLPSPWDGTLHEAGMTTGIT